MKPMENRRVRAVCGAKLAPVTCWAALLGVAPPCLPSQAPSLSPIGSPCSNTWTTQTFEIQGTTDRNVTLMIFNVYGTDDCSGPSLAQKQISNGAGYSLDNRTSFDICYSTERTSLPVEICAEYPDATRSLKIETIHLDNNTMLVQGGNCFSVVCNITGDPTSFQTYLQTNMVISPPA